MPRKTRIFLDNNPTLILIENEKEQSSFNDIQDYNVFLEFTNTLVKENDILLYSYCLVSNSVLFLISSRSKYNITKFIQNLNLKYVKYFNSKYNTTGKLWNSRYKSSLVEESIFLYDVIKFIETLPLRKNLVTNPKLYEFSSINLLRNKEEYDIIYSINQDIETQNFIEKCINNQDIIGSKGFIVKIEKLLNLSIKNNTRGRPKKKSNLINELKGKNMYKNLVVLDKIKHKNLKIKPLPNLKFAMKTSTIPIISDEIPVISESFPIVFTSTNNVELVTLVGLSENSLAVTSEGKWITKYIPTYLKKYPFTMSSLKDNSSQKIILMDIDSEVLNDQEGESLFNEDGSSNKILEKIVEVLTINFKSQNKTKQFIKEILDKDLLEEREIAIGEGIEKKVLVNGFKVVSKDKLKNLDDATIERWENNGIMKLINAHLDSLNNIENLFKILQSRQK